MISHITLSVTLLVSVVADPLVEYELPHARPFGKVHNRCSN